MNVLVIGANGQIGHKLVDRLQATEDAHVRAMVRKEAQVKSFEDKGVEAVLADLEGDLDQLAKAFEDIDTVVFTAGSGPNTGFDKTMAVDLDGAIKTMQIAGGLKVNRYILISSFDTSRIAIQNAPESFRPYVIAKHYADDWLRKSNLAYTIVHPGRLTDDEETDQVTIKEQVEPGNISRSDVSKVLYKTIFDDNLKGKEFQVVEGKTSIVDALKQL